MPDEARGYLISGEESWSRSPTTTCARRGERDGRSRTVRSATSSHGSTSHSRRTPPRSVTHASSTASAPPP